MSTKSKKTLMEVLLGLALGVGYLIFALGSKAPAVEDTAGWAIAMLIALGIGIVAVVIAEILFHIMLSIVITAKTKANNKDADNKDIGKQVESAVKDFTKEDEMDKLIDLKANKFAISFSGAGFLAALIVLACGVGAVVAMQIMLGACLVGALAEGIYKIVCNELGVK